MTTYMINKEFNGIEIAFDIKPNEAVRTALKLDGFRWHRVKKVWYAKMTEARLVLAKQLCEGGEVVLSDTEKKTSTKIEELKGLKIGDILATSWGYEQTNVEVYQVTGFTGKSTAIVREISKVLVKEGNMSGDYKADIDNFIGEPIKKRILGTDKGYTPHIKDDKGHYAYKKDADKTFYVSWYY